MAKIAALAAVEKEQPMSDEPQNATNDYKQLLQEAVRLLDLQRNRTYYKQDEQVENAKQVKEFIERHRNEK